MVNCSFFSNMYSMTGIKDIDKMHYCHFSCTDNDSCDEMKTLVLLTFK